MTGKNSKAVSSVLPMDARTAHIAAGGGFAASSRDFPGGKPDKPESVRAAGPDALDCIAPHAAESRVSASLSVPRVSVQSAPLSNENPN